MVVTEIERLRADEQSLVAQLHQMQGALSYVRQAIARTDKEAQEETAKIKDKPKNGEAPDKTAAPQEPVEA